MDISKITVGKKVSYTARNSTGKGVVQSIEEGGRGTFIHILDKDRTRAGGVVKVRPSQVGAAR